jgi:23S rRNA (cytosine1962-C5)-methyltransferase
MRVAPLEASRILFDDGDVLVVDKPARVSTQSDGTSDLVARVRAWLASEKGEATPYVAAHQLLERDASGIVVLLRKRELNGAFQQALSSGAVEVSYVAAIERKGHRSVVPVAPFRGKLRDALAKLGDVAGIEDGRVPAPRALVHATRLRFPHPRTGKPVEVTSAAPTSFERWASGAWSVAPSLDDGGLEARLDEAIALRWPLFARADLDAFRVVNDAGDALPGVVVDRYGQHAVLSVLTDEAHRHEVAIAEALVARGFVGVYVKRRPKQANVVADTRTDDIAPARPIAGLAASESFVVREGPDRFVVRLGDGLSTGIFLDQRETRAFVRELSAGRSVLNLFAYAGAFTVSAARGGARRTTSVDVAKSVLAWAEENLRENEIVDPSAHAFVAEDALTFLARARARGDRFDLVILDPPSYATTKNSRFTVENDYRALAAAAFRVTSPSGTVIACTNHRGVSPSRFRGFLRDAATAAHVRIRKERERPPPFDFPPAPGEPPHLKTFVLDLEALFLAGGGEGRGGPCVSSGC